ncbi:MAG TPA: F0F1 ATP synthase subunit epsilon [Streptosporangiaceae bacterium]|nr:F0F1 ATP synthase subunit epsilon [Streptosporangiaceae bacterium]
MTLAVELVQPEGELWAGNAEMVIARTLDGEIGILTNHAPIIGILYEGSLVLVRPDTPGQPAVVAAVSGGFLSVANNRVSILAREAVLGADVNTAETQALLDQTLQGLAQPPGPEEPADVRYYRALLAAADQSG